MNSSLSYIPLMLTLLISTCGKTKPKKALESGTFKLIDSIGKDYVLISSGQIMPAKEVIIDDHIFWIATKGTDTVYISTSDSSFKTPEGFNVNMPYSKIPDSIKAKLNKENGWAYYIRLNSGWTLGFCEGRTCTDNPPLAESKINFIFKRH